jgi:hypothetical protein
MTDDEKAVVAKVHQALIEMGEVFKGDAMLRSWALYRAADLMVQTGADPRMWKANALASA